MRCGDRGKKRPRRWRLCFSPLLSLSCCPSLALSFSLFLTVLRACVTVYEKENKRETTHEREMREKASERERLSQTESESKRE